MQINLSIIISNTIQQFLPVQGEFWRNLRGKGSLFWEISSDLLVFFNGVI